MVCGSQVVLRQTKKLVQHEEFYVVFIKRERSKGKKEKKNPQGKKWGTS